jgi:hypothetical protein
LILHQNFASKEPNRIGDLVDAIILIGDKVAVGGPGTCPFMPRGVPHAWKSTGAETGRVLFLYTPAKGCWRSSNGRNANSRR